MKGRKMLLWSVIFLGAFIMLVAAIVIFQKAEEVGEDARIDAIESIRSDLKALMPADEIRENFTAIEAAQQNLRNECLQLINQKVETVQKRIAKVEDNNQILQVRLYGVEKKAALPRTVAVTIEKPVLVDVIRRPRQKAAVSNASTIPTHRGVDSLLKRSGVADGVERLPEPKPSADLLRKYPVSPDAD